MKIYVAGKWEDRRSVQDIQGALLLKGYEITKDWTIDDEGDAGYPVINVVEDIRGVAMADAYVGYFENEHNYRGTLIEFGAALALRKPCYIIGHAIDKCIFIKHPLVTQFDSVEEFLMIVGGIL